MIAQCHKMDPTRLVTAGNDEIASNTPATPEYLAAYENDIVSYNYPDRWRERRELMYSIDKAEFPNRRVVATESGGNSGSRGNYRWGGAGRFGSGIGNIDTEQRWKFTIINDYVIGDFMWTAHDNLGEAGAGRSYWEEEKEKTGLMAGWPWLSCYQGDLALDGERLPRSYYRAVIWGKDPGVHVFTNPPQYAGRKVMGTGFHWHDVRPLWTYPEAYIGHDIDVEAYADCDKVEFYVNGTLAATAEPEESIFYATVTYQPGTLRAVAYKNGEKIAEDTLTTTGHATSILLEADGTPLVADGMELTYVTATLVDDKGQRVYDEDIELKAEVSGAAVLEGFGSNNPCTEENFGTGRRRTWNGKATLVLRAGLKPGEAVLTVSSASLPTVQSRFTVR